MKILLFAIAFLLIQIELFAQPCPPGFHGPATVTVEVCEGCFIQATWCCDTIITPFGNKPAIHFSEILILNECPCLSWMQHSNGDPIPSIPWDLLIGAVLGSDTLCFQPPPSLPPCEPAPPTQFNMIVTNGGCYRYIDDLNGRRYVTCATDVQALCYENYKICWEFVDGQWNIKVEGLGKQPAFNCINSSCFPLCD